MPVARLGAGLRAVIVGKTKSGKTHLTQTAASQVDSLVVIDSKRSPKPNEPAAWAARVGIPVSTDPADIMRHRRLVWQVSERSLRDRAGWNRPGSWGWLWTAGLRALKRRRNTVVNFNEGLQTLPANGCHPEAIEIATQGAGFDLSAWIETQAANWISTVMLRQVEVLIAFRCRARKDRDLIADARGVDAELLAELLPFHWAYHDIGDDDLAVFDPLPAPTRPRVRAADAAAAPEPAPVPESGDNAHEQPDQEMPTISA